MADENNKNFVKILIPSVGTNFSKWNKKIVVSGRSSILSVASPSQTPWSGIDYWYFQLPTEKFCKEICKLQNNFPRWKKFMRAFYENGIYFQNFYWYLYIVSFQLPLDLSTLTEEERKRRLEGRKPQVVVKVEEDLEDSFSAKKYLRYVKK